MKVSIVIATYGDEAWATRATGDAYRSAIRQEPNHQVVLNHEPDGTLAQSRNAGAEVSSGDWLCFLDADDRLHPGYLSAMAEAERPDGPCLLIPRLQYVRPLPGSGPQTWAGTGTPPHFPNRERSFEELNHAVIGTLVPRDFFLTLGGFAEEPLYEDWALWLRCLRAGAEPVYVEDAIYQADPAGVRNGQRELARHWYHQILAEHLRLA